MKEQVKKYILANLKNITLLLILYLIGIVLGFFIFIFLDNGSKNEIISSISETINLVNFEGYEDVHIIKNGMQVNTVILAVLIVASFTVITFGIVSSLMVLKGISLSIYICILFLVLGPLKGSFAMLCIAIIPNLITILTYIFIGNECYNISNELLQKVNNSNIAKTILKIMSICVMSLPFIILSLWIEQIFFRIIIGG